MDLNWHRYKARFLPKREQNLVQTVIKNQEMSIGIRRTINRCAMIALNSGPVGFMAYGDLWGYNLNVLIFINPVGGFMGIYGRTLGDINLHKSP